MDRIGLYKQLTNFTNEHAGTAEWCKAERQGRQFFVKKFHSPVYPSREIGLPEKMYKAGVEEFHEALSHKQKLYQSLRECDQTGVLVIPLEVINYQFHICTIAEFVSGNISPDRIHLLSEWQRLVLLRTLTLALMNVHQAGVVHSDMKPDNVLVTQDSDGNCKLRLIDFDGSFFESEPPEDPEDVAGDPAFFAPESYRKTMEEDVALDHRIDIFALGIIFHYFWTGRYPDKPENRTIGECMLLGEPVTVDPDIPLVLKQLILKMTAPEPDNRISLKSVYDVLGVQIGLYPPTILNLQNAAAPERTEVKKHPTEKQAEVRIEYRDQDGFILQYRIMKLPFGSVNMIDAEEIKGYRLADSSKKEVRVQPDGHVNSPVIFHYAQQYDSAVPAKKSGKAWKILLGVGIFLTICLILIFALGQPGRAEQGDESAKGCYLTEIMREGEQHDL